MEFSLGFLILNKSNYREQINKLNNEKDDSIETVEKVFDFVIKARSKFNH